MEGMPIDFSGGFFKRINYEGENLTKRHQYDAGLDLHAAEDCLILPGGRGLVRTGVALEIIPGYAGIIRPRSGLAVNYGIMVGAGVIDSTYRGEVKVLLFNLGSETFRVYKGDRIAQLLTIPVNLGFYQEVEWLSETERGGHGFGSSGK